MHKGIRNDESAKSAYDAYRVHCCKILISICRRKRLAADLPPSDPPMESSPEPGPPKTRRISKHHTSDKGYSHTTFAALAAANDGDNNDEYGDEFNQLNAELGLISPLAKPIELCGEYEVTGSLSRAHITGPRSPSASAPFLSVDALEGLQVLRKVRVLTEAWVTNVGPMGEWPRLFQQGFDAACETHGERTTQQCVDEYLEGVRKHALEGRLIIHTLRASPVVRPPPSHEAWGDFLAAGDMLEILYRGVSMLEVRLDILAPQGPVSSSGDSNIRRWKSLGDKF